MREVKTNPGRVTRPGFSELGAAIQPAEEAAARLNRTAGRFEVYDYLKAIYRIYRKWKYRKVAKRAARLLANELSIAQRKGTSPIRILIEATLPDANVRQKSRWVRALEHVSSEGIPAREFRKFIRTRGGVAGCARLAVNVNRKRKRPGGDWND
jgi:hypothetical protein